MDHARLGHAYVDFADESQAEVLLTKNPPPRGSVARAVLSRFADLSPKHFRKRPPPQMVVIQDLNIAAFQGFSWEFREKIYNPEN